MKLLRRSEVTTLAIPQEIHEELDVGHGSLDLDRIKGWLSKRVMQLLSKVMALSDNLKAITLTVRTKYDRTPLWSQEVVVVLC